jgi:hypothetical protein
MLLRYSGTTEIKALLFTGRDGHSSGISRFISEEFVRHDSGKLVAASSKNKVFTGRNTHRIGAISSALRCEIRGAELLFLGFSRRQQHYHFARTMAPGIEAERRLKRRVLRGVEVVMIGFVTTKAWFDFLRCQRLTTLIAAAHTGGIHVERQLPRAPVLGRFGSCVPALATVNAVNVKTISG